MTNEEFQRIVLEKLEKLETGQKELVKEQKEIKEELASIRTTLSRVEIATADNWSDIAKLKSVR